MEIQFFLQSDERTTLDFTFDHEASTRHQSGIETNSIKVKMICNYHETYAIFWKNKEWLRGVSFCTTSDKVDLDPFKTKEVCVSFLPIIFLKFKQGFCFETVSGVKISHTARLLSVVLLNFFFTLS